MDPSGDRATVEKLIKAFLQFRGADWTHKADTGYRNSEIKVLLCLYREKAEDRPHMRVSEISRKMRVTSPTVTQLLNSLETNGLVERTSDESDRRTVLVKLTPQGKTVVETARQEFYQFFSGLADYLGEEESGHLADLLSKAFTYLTDKKGGSAHPPANGVDRHC